MEFLTDKEKAAYSLILLFSQQSYWHLQRQRRPSSHPQGVKVLVVGEIDKYS